MKPLELKDLSVEQKIGLLIVARGVADPEDMEFALHLIRNHALGGVQITVQEGAPEKYIKPLLEAADYPVFIAADMERGYQLGDLQIPGNIALGALDDPKLAYEFARITATQAKKAGYNMIWSPVVDAIPHDGPCKISRSMGADKKRIAAMATEYMRAFADCGIVGSAKHFPSVSDVVADTHMCEGHSEHTREELLETNLYPYRAMVEALGEDMMGIMTSHERLPKIDPDYPMTLSKKGLSLLDEIGFTGIRISDSFAMLGILQNFGEERALGLAINAGVDLLLPNYRTRLKTSYEYLMNCYRNGMFTEERLNEAAAKVLWAQKRTLRQPEVTEITDADREIFRRLNRDCICAVTEPGLSPALDTEKRHLFAILTENVYPEEDNSIDPEIRFTKWWDPDRMAEMLKKRFPNSDCCFLCELPNWKQNEAVCLGAVDHDDVVFVTFCDTSAYLGTDGLTERIYVLMRAVAQDTAAIVHVGNPYAMEKAPHVPRLVFGFPSVQCLEDVTRVLAGEIPAKGNLPVTLKLQ